MAIIICNMIRCARLVPIWIVLLCIIGCDTDNMDENIYSYDNSRLPLYYIETPETSLLKYYNDSVVVTDFIWTDDSVKVIAGKTETKAGDEIGSMIKKVQSELVRLNNPIESCRINYPGCLLIPRKISTAGKPNNNKDYDKGVNKEATNSINALLRQLMPYINNQK